MLKLKLSGTTITEYRNVAVADADVLFPINQPHDPFPTGWTVAGTAPDRRLVASDGSTLVTEWDESSAALESDGGTSPAEVHLSSADILSLAASPVDAGLPFGPDILAIPTRVATLTAPGATPYANGSVVQLQVGPRLNLWYIGIARANVVTAASPQLAYCSYWDFLMGSIDEQSLTPSQFLNQPWVVTVDTDEFTDGDGTVEVRIGYYLFDFS